MKHQHSLLIAALVVTAFLTALPVRAAEDLGSPVMYPVLKLSRGIANAGFGVLELPMKTWDVTQDQGGIAGLTWGVLKGVSYVIAREVVGVIEVATFLFPLPGCPNNPDDVGWGYGPIMFPTWVVDPQHDWGGFVYDEKATVKSKY